MSAKQKDAQQNDPKPAESRPLIEIIGRQVLDALGRPTDFQRVRVCPLWTGHFRVNVFVGNDTSSVRVANSYFLIADTAGNIINSEPAITRQY
jgi:hypothetical protein